MACPEASQGPGWGGDVCIHFVKHLKLEAQKLLLSGAQQSQGSQKCYVPEGDTDGLEAWIGVRL